MLAHIECDDRDCIWETELSNGVKLETGTSWGTFELPWPNPFGDDVLGSSGNARRPVTSSGVRRLRQQDEEARR
jgi:hypothetical protein